MILLDTYTLIGLTSEASRLSVDARQLLEESRNQLYVSAISAFEIAVAVQKNRLVLPHSPRVWFERALASGPIEVIDVTWEIALASSELPPHHADPADRIIIATAVSHNLTLLTPDQKIHRYVEAKVVW